MRALAGSPEQDDQDPARETDDDRLDCDKDRAMDAIDGIWDAINDHLDPFCGWCGEQGSRWVMRDGVAVIAPCEKCSGLDD